MEEERLIDVHAFSTRLKDAIFPEKLGVFAQRAGISMGVLSKYLNPVANMSPSVEVLARICRATSTTIDWLLLGVGDSPAPTDRDTVKVPRYDVQFAGGSGAITDKNNLVGDMPFDRGLISSLGISSLENLAVVDLEGDSMAPLISDGARVLLDLSDTRLKEGIFAFRLGDDLRIKRLSRRGLEGIEAKSVNPIYEPELITPDMMPHFTVIGRALWAGTRL